MGQLAGKQSTGEPRPVDLCIVCTCSEDKKYYSLPTGGYPELACQLVRMLNVDDSDKVPTLASHRTDQLELPLSAFSKHKHKFLTFLIIDDSSHSTAATTNPPITVNYSS